MAIELQRSLDSRPTPRRTAVLAPLIADPAAARNRIVTELRSAWDLLIAPSWPRIDELVTADIAHRGAVIARAGLAAALDDLHADVHSDGDTLRVRGGDPIALDLAGAGLCLMPSAFVWPLALIVRDAGWPPTLAYPARGVAAMWTEPPAPPDSLARLLGATRAAILADLANARTTSQLGHRHQLAQATVSEHLAALAGARLLTRRRDRREVRYQRTGLGDRLVRADTDAATQEPSV